MQAEAASEADQRVAPSPQPHTAPRRIVIVEDNADVRDLLRLKLRRLGHQVISVGDGIEGLRHIVDCRPDLALVDLGLPGMDGFEAARRARDALGQNVVLVAVSGFGQPGGKRRALKSHRLYTGLLTDLVNRVRQHKEGSDPNGFRARYNFDRLVYFETHPRFAAAVAREKQIKAWTRAKRVALI